VFVREREELLAEGALVRTRGVTAEPKGEGVEPCDAKQATELRGWETGVAWADALRAALAVATPAWSPQRARAFRVAAASGDEAGGRFGGGWRMAQRGFRRTRPGFR